MFLLARRRRSGAGRGRRWRGRAVGYSSLRARHSLLLLVDFLPPLLDHLVGEPRYGGIIVRAEFIDGDADSGLSQQDFRGLQAGVEVVEELDERRAGFLLGHSLVDGLASKLDFFDVHGVRIEARGGVVDDEGGARVFQRAQPGVR